MIHDDTYLNPRILAVELLHSIRDIDCRIDELKMLIDANGLQQEKRKRILERICTLIDTRYKLIDSLEEVTKHDPDLGDSCNPFDYFVIEYDELKSEIFRHHPEIEEAVRKRNG